MIETILKTCSARKKIITQTRMRLKKSSINAKTGLNYTSIKTQTIMVFLKISRIGKQPSPFENKKRMRNSCCPNINAIMSNAKHKARMSLKKN